MFLGLKWVHRPNSNIRGFPTTNKQFSDMSRVSNKFNSILAIFTYRYHEVPQDKGSVPQAPPPSPGTYTHTSDASGKPRLSPVLLTKGLYGVKFQ